MARIFLCHANEDKPQVAHWQGNRNPFIDHPEWVATIWGARAVGES